VLIAPSAREALGLTEAELRRVPFRATTGAGK
jgi:hypothetical protein